MLGHGLAITPDILHSSEVREALVLIRSVVNMLLKLFLVSQAAFAHCRWAGTDAEDTAAQRTKLNPGGSQLPTLVLPPSPPVGRHCQLGYVPGGNQKLAKCSF